jgi:hypothetical protein
VRESTLDKARRRVDAVFDDRDQRGLPSPPADTAEHTIFPHGPFNASVDQTAARNAKGQIASGVSDRSVQLVSWLIPRLPGLPANKSLSYRP